MVIALIVNGEGFPLSYETLDGDRSDVTTLEGLMRMVERKYGRARRVWVFDRGIVSEANLEALRKRGGQYLVGTPRSKLKEFEKALLEGDWKQIRGFWQEGNSCKPLKIVVGGAGIEPATSCVSSMRSSHLS